MASLAQLALSLTAGALTTLSPCVFPILPLVLGGAAQTHRLAPLVMGAGMASSFALIGLFLGLAGPALGLDAEHVQAAGAWLLIIFGIVMLVPGLSQRFTRALSPLAGSANQLSQRLPRDSLWGALSLGGVLGLVWSPCSGPLLAAALTLVAAEGGAAQGSLILGLFGIGAATPLVGVAYASRQGFLRVRAWVSQWAGVVKTGFGGLLLLLGLAILSGGDKLLQAQALDLLPDAWVQLTVRY